MPELALALLETELAEDALVGEALETTAAAEELTGAFAEETAVDGETALDGVFDATVEEPATEGVADGVVEAAAGVELDEEPGAARAGTAAPARTTR